MTTVFSHYGICVSDMEASTRFYVEALGYTKAEDFTVGNEFAALMGLDEVTLASQFLEKDGARLELLAFAVPGTVGEAAMRPINKLGLTHLSFRVEDVDAVAALVEQHGGTVHPETRTTMGTLDFVYCSDPDGTRVELMKLG
jgi:catechol 2,3-dioxygenase-like lactoylglutathione lyase family enzyme